MTLSDSNLQGVDFSGLVDVLAGSLSGNNLDIMADIEGEQETMPAHANVDDNNNNNSPHDHHENPIGQLPVQWKETMAQAARGVTDNTHYEYIQ